MDTQKLTFKDVMAYDKRNIDVYQAILERYKTKGIIPFVGAGLSVAAGFRTWEGFLNHEYTEYMSGIEKPSDQLDAASELNNTLGTIHFREDIMKEFGYKYSKNDWNDIINNVQNEAVGLLPKLFHNVVVTTNFDRLLEHLYPTSIVSHPGHDGQLNRALQINTPTIFKLHGCISDPEELILTRESYTKVYETRKNKNVVMALEKILTNQTVLFLGCSLKNDYTIKYWTKMLSQPKGKGIEHFAIVSCAANELQTKRRDLGNMNISSILYDKNNREAVRVILNQLYMDANNEMGNHLDGKYFFNYSKADSGVIIITQTHPLQPSDYFRGRKDKLKEVKQLLIGEAKLMLLNGMGGIGKTEFCRKLFRECINEKLPEIKKVGWLVFHESIEQTLFQQFTEISFQTDNPAEYLMQAVRYLDNHKGDMLLFIDNANELSESDAALLLKLRCKVVLTSRRRSIERLQAIEIGKLTLEDCRILYRQHSEEYSYNADYNYGVTFSEDDSPDEDLDAIIEMADRHTLAIELLAKTQKSAAYTTHDMHKMLKKTGFSLSDIPESVTYVHTPEVGNWDKTEQIFIEQFSKVLDISNIKNEKLRILQLFSLLSMDTIAAENVRKWFKIDDLDMVNALVSQGWVFRGRIGEQLDVAFSMHPLITSVVRHKALPSFETATPLVIGLTDVLDYDDADLFTNRLPHINHAVSLVETISGEYNEYPDLINCIAIVLVQMAEYDKALTLLEKAKNICEFAENINPIITSSVYHNMAGCYIRQGKIAQAKEWYEKSIAIRKDCLDTKSIQLANSYDCLGNVYELLGCYKDALILMESALEIRKNILGNKHPQIAISYNNMGCVHDSLGNYQQALELHKMSLSIQKKAKLDKNHPDLATTYTNLGRVYGRFGKINNALKYYNMALAAGEAIFGHEHPDVFTTRDGIADLYLDIGEYKIAEKQFAEILEARIRTLGENHQDTAANYQNLGIAYFYQDRLDKALELFKKALDIDKSLLGERHTNVASILRNIADVYSKIKNMDDKALELYINVLDIQLEAFGENHPYVAISCNNVGKQYAEKGDYKQAMKYYWKALHIHENTIGRKHIDTFGVLYNIGCVHKEYGELQTALDYFFEAYEIIKDSYGNDMPEIATISDGIAVVYDKLENFPNANEWFENAIRLYKKFFSNNNIHLSVTYYLYANSLEKQAKYAKALRVFTMAYEIQLMFYDSNHEIIRNVKDRIATLKKNLSKKILLNTLPVYNILLLAAKLNA
jgi:tetratricopeptide (TPR) repeat protein